ncbi:hypothetical protein niasHS_013676 [Heterodera schachtii]|uniref:Uncharacterized protein n=1 Tax=Heterodera schachtii TaxID=97005 RepID=A0ABD2I6R0_HETSC
MIHKQNFFVVLPLLLLHLVAQLAPSVQSVRHDESEIEEDEGKIFSDSTPQSTDGGKIFSDSTRQSADEIFHNDEEDEETKQLNKQEIEEIEKQSLEEGEKEEEEPIKLAIKKFKEFHGLNEEESAALQLCMVGMKHQAMQNLDEESRAKVKERFQLWKIGGGVVGSASSAGYGVPGLGSGSSPGYSGPGYGRPHLDRAESSKSAEQRARAAAAQQKTENEKPKKQTDAEDESVNGSELDDFEKDILGGMNSDNYDEALLNAQLILESEKRVAKVVNAWKKLQQKKQNSQRTTINDWNRNLFGWGNAEQQKSDAENDSGNEREMSYFDRDLMRGMENQSLFRPFFDRKPTGQMIGESSYSNRVQNQKSDSDNDSGNESDLNGFEKDVLRGMNSDNYDEALSMLPNQKSRDKLIKAWEKQKSEKHNRQRMVEEWKHPMLFGWDRNHEEKVAPEVDEALDNDADATFLSHLRKYYKQNKKSESDKDENKSEDDEDNNTDDDADDDEVDDDDTDDDTGDNKASNSDHQDDDDTVSKKGRNSDHKEGDGTVSHMERDSDQLMKHFLHRLYGLKHTGQKISEPSDSDSDQGQGYFLDRLFDQKSTEEKLTESSDSNSDQKQPAKESKPPTPSSNSDNHDESDHENSNKKIDLAKPKVDSDTKAYYGESDGNSNDGKSTKTMSRTKSNKAKKDDSTSKLMKKKSGKGGKETKE